MSSVLFYISGHGFGHASREVEVINALGAARPDLTIVLRTAVSCELLTRTIRVPYTLDAGPCDTGIVQSSSLAHDDEATVRAAIGYYAAFDDHIRQEVARMPMDTRAIVTDIAPVACEAGARRALPVLAVGNFTWDWIYETHPGLTQAAPWLVPRLRAAYARATEALQLPFAGGFEIFPRCRRIPLIARHATRRRDETRDRFGIPRDRRAALLSFGGYGLPALNVGGIDALGEWTIVTTDRTAASNSSGSSGAALPPGVTLLSEREFVGTGFRYEDLVAAADVVITKPGYGISAECVTSGTALLYTSRGEFREYDLLVREMPRYIRTRFISQDDLFAGRWRASLEALRSQPTPPETLETNGADVAARAIIDLAAI